MTRKEIMAEYDVQNGIIVSPGKFEGEAIYAPAIYDIVMNGFADLTLDFFDETIDIVNIDDDLTREFPEISKDTVCIAICENDIGFASVRELTESTLADLKAQYARECSDED